MHPLLELKKIGFTPHGRNEPIISDITFSTRNSKCISIVGPNGSGKSTLLQAIAGLYSDKEGDLEGDVLIGGTSILNIDTKARASSVSYLPADLYTSFGLTVRQILEMGRYIHQNHNEELWNEYTSALLLQGLLQRDIRTLSGGERQRVLIARGLLQNPKILILDETLSKMDLEHQSRVGSLLRQWSKDRIVFLVSHDLNYALGWADELMALKSGKLLFTESLLNNVAQESASKKLSEIYASSGLQWIKDEKTGRLQALFRF